MMRFLHTNYFCTALLAVVTLSGATVARAGTITYSVSVDTSAYSSGTGYLELTFLKGGATALDATASILGFKTDGSLGAVDSSSFNFSGTLPDDISVDAGWNDYYQQITFGTALRFLVTIQGAALDNPAIDGSTLTLGLFAGDGSGLLTTSGLVATIDINSDATVTPTALTEAATIGAVPEPASLFLAGSALIPILWFRRRRQRS